MVAMVVENDPVIPAPRSDSVGQADMLIGGMSYRQLDYWTRCRLVHAEQDHVGSGARRTWSVQERAIACAIARLIAVGFRLDVAARLAREHATSEDLTARLGPNIALTLLPDLWAPSGEQAPDHSMTHR
jgi:hypothetical protein